MFHCTQRSIDLPQRANKESEAGWMSLESARASAFPEGFSASLNTRVPNILHFLSVSIKFPSTCPAHKLLWAMAQKWWFPVVRCLSQPLPISHLHTVFSVGCSPGSLVSCTPSTTPPPPQHNICTSSCFSSPSSSHFSAFVIRVTAFAICYCASTSLLNI